MRVESPRGPQATTGHTSQVLGEQGLVDVHVRFLYARWDSLGNPRRLCTSAELVGCRLGSFQLKVPFRPHVAAMSSMVLE